MNMKNRRVLLFRSTQAPSVRLPLGARSAGHYRVGPDFRDAVAVKHFVQFFWCVRGAGIIVIDGRAQALTAGKTALYFPGDRHELFGDGRQNWEYRWWTCDGPLAAAMVHALGFERAGLWDCGSMPVAVHQQLLNAIRHVTPAAEYRAASLAFELAARAAAGIQVRPPMPVRPSRHIELPELFAIIHRHWNRPEFGVAQLAELAGEHRSSLCRRFVAQTGLSPGEYLRQWRIQKALSQLKQTDQSIAAIAAACGWTDPNYFSRAIRSATGQSPREFRKS
jgi:AraC-like DNA-binding protein